MSQTRIAAVTGANKGIGLAIVRNLALRYPSSAVNKPSAPLLIYLTARDKSRGEQALKDIQSDAQLADAKALRKDGGLTEVKYHPLDVSEDQSIENFASFLKNEHPDGIDILVNNAGVAIDGFDSQKVHDTLRTNYYGTLNLTTLLLPHMRPHGRIVNVSSLACKLTSKYSSSVVSSFQHASSIADINGLLENYQKSVDNNTHEKDGWPSSAYSVSKTGITGVTGVLARHAQEMGANQGILINSCCPGYISTDMTKHRARKTPDQGARTPVLLACGDIQGTTGQFWEHESLSSW